jgi:uncharacterized protein
MKNPFEYGGVVTGHAFCNREAEKSDLLKAIRNDEKLFVFSERRFGKTSLVRSVIAKLPRKLCVHDALGVFSSEPAKVLERLGQ